MMTIVRPEDPAAAVRSSDQSRFVTIVLPIRNEELRIRSVLERVLAQDYPPDRLEILVIDGQSTDATPSIVADMARIDSRLRLLDNPELIVPAAMNQAIRAARGSIIVRVDGHTLIATDYVSRCVAELERSGAVNVGGPMRPVGEGYWAEAIALATTSRFGVGDGAFHNEAVVDDNVDTVYMGAFRREALVAVGGYDEELACNEDDELNFRLRAAGGRIALVPTIRSTYFNRSTLTALWRQYWRYGLWKVRVVQKHPASLQARHAIPPLFALAMVGASLLRLLDGPGRHLWLLVALPWFGGSLAATWQAIRATGRFRLAPALPVVFGVLHLSYGLGALWGLLRFAPGWRRRHGGTNATVQR